MVWIWYLSCLISRHRAAIRDTMFPSDWRDHALFAPFVMRHRGLPDIALTIFFSILCLSSVAHSIDGVWSGPRYIPLSLASLL